jgi:hypothetical protein
VNIVLAGSRAIPLVSVRLIVVKLLSELVSEDPKLRILLRHPVSASPAAFETMTADIADSLSIPVQWCYPDPRGGREGTYVRDAHMTAMADHVFAFFTPDTLMEGGTGHVVDKAIDKEIPVTAYEVDETGLRWVGSM